MTATEGAIISGLAGMAVAIAWKWYRGGAGEPSLNSRTGEKPGDRLLGSRSVVIKVAAGALVAAFCSGLALLVLGHGPGDIAIGLLGAAAAGALIGGGLVMADVVAAHQSKRLRVHPVLRAYFGRGEVSVALWVVSLFAAGIAGIFLYYAYLSPGVGPAH